MHNSNKIEKTSTEQKIINQFRNLTIDHNCNTLKIIELGVSNFGLTKIIRKAFQNHSF